MISGRKEQAKGPKPYSWWFTFQLRWFEHIATFFDYMNALLYQHLKCNNSKSFLGLIRCQFTAVSVCQASLLISDPRGEIPQTVHEAFLSIRPAIWLKYLWSLKLPVFPIWMAWISIETNIWEMKIYEKECAETGVLVELNSRNRRISKKKTPTLATTVTTTPTLTFKKVVLSHTTNELPGLLGENGGMPVC